MSRATRLATLHSTAMLGASHPGTILYPPASNHSPLVITPTGTSGGSHGTYGTEAPGGPYAEARTRSPYVQYGGPRTYVSAQLATHHVSEAQVPCAVEARGDRERGHDARRGDVEVVVHARRRLDPLRIGLALRVI